MARLFLILAFTTAGFNFVALKLGSVFHTHSPLFINVSLCLPAVLLGAAAWLTIRSFAKSWPVIVCVVLAWVGLLYAFKIQKNRGIVGASYLAMALPIGALIVRHRCWWLCAKVYVLANAFSMALALWFEYQILGANMAASSFRFGFLWGNDGRRLSNPNIVGGQLAFAAVLAFMLYLRGNTRQDRNNTRTTRPEHFSLGWTVLLSLGCLLTASRGASIAWLGGMGLLWVGGTRWQEPGKFRDLVATSILLLVGLIFAATATGFAPWGTLQKRYEKEALSVVSGTGRFELWKTALDAWRSCPQYFLVGTGTGVAPNVLGEFCGYVMDDGVSIAASDAHNAFVEWGLSFGLLGMIAGTCLMVTIVRRAHQLDRRHGSVNRRAVLLCFCLSSMGYVTFYQLFFVAAGGLILAMLSEPLPIVADTSCRPREVSPSREEDRWDGTTRPPHLYHPAEEIIPGMAG